jgi:glycosyltransferase involved in cell wall biosynthesis
LSDNLKDNLPNSAIVLFNAGAFGGAPKRYTNLFLHLNKIYPGKFYFIINKILYKQVHEMFENLPENYIKVIDLGKRDEYKAEESSLDIPRLYKVDRQDPLEIDKKHTIARKIYWYFKNKNHQHSLFKMIEKLRVELDIKVFYAVFSGVMPLVFYLDENPRRAAVIFSDMDSWFKEVLPAGRAGMEKLWYRKYYSFNYAFEHCDAVDFLSPYIHEGIKKLGIKLKEGLVHISPCSFIDYSQCSAGDKKSAEGGFEIAFSGRLEPGKNPLLYLEAAKEILKKYPHVRFHLLGEGPLVLELKNFIDTNNLSSSVNFQFNKNPPEIFKETSVFVSLQTHTNYPSQSVLEAMACGNAVVASNRGDTKLFINSSNGILTEMNKDDIVSALEKLIKEPELTRSLGQNGKEFVLKNHTIEKFTDYFLGLIEEARAIL